jgi:hypothetical protein
VIFPALHAWRKERAPTFAGHEHAWQCARKEDYRSEGNDGKDAFG